MALSKVQVGLIGQMEFIKLGTLGSKGALDYASPYADDDRRDHEIHRRGRMGSTLSVQTKVMRTLRKFGRVPHLKVTFFVTRHRLATSRRFWYFFAHLDRKRMRFSDPCFLAPSTVVHRHCRVGRRGNILEFTFNASMGQESQDMWCTYRVTNAEVGAKLLTIVNDLDSSEPAAAQSLLTLVPGAIIVRRRAVMAG